MGIILVRWQYSTFQFENLKIWLAHHQQQQQQATAPWPWTKIGQAWRLHHKCPGLMWTSGTQWSCEAPGWILRSQVADTARLRALGQKLAVGTSKQHHKQWVHRVTLRKLHFFTLLHLHLSTTFWILLISLDRIPEILKKVDSSWFSSHFECWLTIHRALPCLGIFALWPRNMAGKWKVVAKKMSFLIGYKWTQIIASTTASGLLWINVVDASLVGPTLQYFSAPRLPAFLGSCFDVSGYELCYNND